MPKEINPRRKWKRVILCLDYSCLNIYLFGEWSAENNRHLRAKNLRMVNRLKLQGTGLESCGLFSGSIPDFELLPPTTTHPGDVEEALNPSRGKPRI